ncbi:MAG: DUF222 domain-containing protein [Aeromicrobium sp.]
MLENVTVEDPMGVEEIDAIVAFDRVVRAAQAGQAASISRLDAKRRRLIKLGSGDHSLSVIGELAMARCISPSAAGNQYGFAVGLGRLPRVAEIFASGGISEPAARAVVREATGLDGGQAAKFDRRVGAQLTGMTERQAADLARSITISIDSQAAYERAVANRRDRFVSLFPNQDGVAVLQVRGPAEQMVAVFNALKKTASALLADGDIRTKGQIMIDTLVQRVTGLETACGVGIEIGLAMTVGSLMHADEMPAILSGYGPIPPELAHDLISEADKSWIRRLFIDPVDGHLVDQDNRRRLFDRHLARFIAGRDVRCRQPGCESPIRAHDHIKAYSEGGLTTASNGQGLCTRSHTFKHLPGWMVTAEGDDIRWQTPTGHSYRSTPPPLIPDGRRASGRLRQ